MSGESYLIQSFRTVQQRIQTCLQRLQQTGKYAPKSVRLVAVSKTKPKELIAELFETEKHLHFGENYVQEICDKAPALPSGIQWHFIGHLQSNKVKQLLEHVPNLYTIETVDRMKIAETIHKEWKKLHRTNKINIFVQVNTSGEEQKSGIDPGKPLQELVEYIIDKCSETLQFKGLMTIGSVQESLSSEQKNKDFETLIQCRKDLMNNSSFCKNLFAEEQMELSMGMSHDFETAIEYGATNVRVGSLIFGERKYNQEQQ